MMINVAFCIDDDFAPYLAVSLVSLLDNTQSHLSIFIIGNLSNSVKQVLHSLTNERTCIRFVTHSVSIPQSELSDRYQGRLNGITFVRYALAEILPDLNKVIYLDADILVTGDISALWQEPLGEQVAGVVEDHSLMSQHRAKTLGLLSQRYFNAGVMVIDLAKWRERGTFVRLMHVHSSEVLWEYNDQDVLNKVLDNDTQYLNGKYNAQTYTLSHHLVDTPVIVHFTGQEKPWHLSSVHPFTAQYRAFFDNVPFINNTLSLFLDKEDHLILEQLGDLYSTGCCIVIWGAGARGRRLIKALEQHYPFIVIKQVVDTYLKGNCFSFPIVPPEEMKLDYIDAVVVATLPHKQSITNLLRDKAVKVI
ncbi:glycosyltransferase family 8 protein [Alteromonas sp.]|nr:glycosyltransferase family 8 protein [Alteromonas sp.]